jgi:hypothetical protein
MWRIRRSFAVELAQKRGQHASSVTVSLDVDLVAGHAIDPSANQPGPREAFARNSGEQRGRGAHAEIRGQEIKPLDLIRQWRHRDFASRESNDEVVTEPPEEVVEAFTNVPALLISDQGKLAS